MSLHLFNFYFLPILYVCAVAIEEWESIYMLSYIYLPVGWEKHFIILGISDISLKINALYNSSTDVRLSAANLKWNGQIWKKMFFLSRLVISFCLLLFQTKKLCNLVNNKQIAKQNFQTVTHIEMQAELISLILKLRLVILKIQFVNYKSSLLISKN